MEKSDKSWWHHIGKSICRMHFDTETNHSSDKKLITEVHIQPFNFFWTFSNQSPFFSSSNGLPRMWKSSLFGLITSLTPITGYKILGSNYYFVNPLVLYNITLGSTIMKVAPIFVVDHVISFLENADIMIAWYVILLFGCLHTLEWLVFFVMFEY